MLRTLASMRSTVKGNLGNHSQLADADANLIIQGCAREITEEYEWSHRNREAVVSLIAPYSTGTVALTQGSAVVTGSGTAWTSAMIGRAIRLPGLESLLRVATVPSGTSLTLGDPQLTAVTWPLTNVSGGVYSILATEYELPSDVALVKLGNERLPIVERSRDWIEAKDRLRTSAGTPRVYAVWRHRIDGSPNTHRTFIEFWPAPSTATVVRLPYLAEAPALSADTDLPACPSQLIELLATSRCADFIFSKTGDARWGALSDRYYRRYFGGGGDVGAYERMKADDEARHSYERRLGGGGGQVGLDDWARHDFEEIA